MKDTVAPPPPIAKMFSQQVTTIPHGDSERLDWLDQHCSFVADHEYCIGPFKVGQLREMADAGLRADAQYHAERADFRRYGYKRAPVAVADWVDQ